MFSVFFGKVALMQEGPQNVRKYLDNYEILGNSFFLNCVNQNGKNPKIYDVRLVLDWPVAW